MNYSDLVTNLSNLLVVPVDDSSFVSILPALINDAEQRIYRELDFLSNRLSFSTFNFVSGSRLVVLPSSTIVVQGLNVITPVGTTILTGTRVPLERVSYDFIDVTWPTAASTGTPQFFSMGTDLIATVSPTPDANYMAEVIGTFRPAAISASNTTTWLGDHLPDLLLAACMIFGAAYLRDYGQMSDDPKIAMTWENHYQLHKQSAVEEEQRRKSQGTNWTPFSVTPLSNPRT